MGIRIRPIFLRLCRSEKDDSDEGGGELIGATLVAREARGQAAESLTGAWKHVNGQLVVIPAVLCRSVEDLPDDRSYVLIGDPVWKIRRKQ